MKIKKSLVLLFVLFHLSLIFFQAFWSTLDVYWTVRLDKTLSIPILDLFKQNENIEPYYIFSGTNTGYGFYGIQTATEKYLRTTYLNSAGNVLASNRHHGFQTLNGRTRFKSYASFLGNYISDTEKLKEKTNVDESFKKVLEFRQNYIKKSFKWIGMNNAKKIKNCESYKVELISIVPVDMMEKGANNEKPKLYAIQEYTFPIQ
ncbi:hypothetical protein [Flavivirga aquatica]|nr:hypothetical protein [Flavivirga aquatica]